MIPFLAPAHFLAGSTPAPARGHWSLSAPPRSPRLRLWCRDQFLVLLMSLDVTPSESPSHLPGLVTWLYRNHVLIPV